MSAPRPILLHGAVGGPQCWSAQDGHFPGAAAIALPGHPSGTPMTDLGEVVRFVAGLLERVPGPRVLVGHGLGAAVALEVALAVPEAVSGVVAVACGSVLRWPDPAEDLEAAVSEILRRGLVDPQGEAGQVMGRAMRAGGVAAMRADALLCRQVYLGGGRLADLGVPAMFVAGGADEIVPPAAVTELAVTAPVRETVIVPGAAHVVMADAPVPFNRVLAAFLARVELTLDDR